MTPNSPLYDSSFRKIGVSVHQTERLSMLHLPAERTPTGLFAVACAVGVRLSRADRMGGVAMWSGERGLPGAFSIGSVEYGGAHLRWWGGDW
jgi:hypothetical protein